MQLSDRSEHEFPHAQHGWNASPQSGLPDDSKDRGNDLYAVTNGWVLQKCRTMAQNTNVHSLDLLGKEKNPVFIFGDSVARGLSGFLELSTKPSSE
jgi:hypothetical protein